MYVPPSAIPAETTTIATPRYELNTQPSQQSVDAEDSATQIQDDLGMLQAVQFLSRCVFCICF